MCTATACRLFSPRWVDHSTWNCTWALRMNWDWRSPLSRLLAACARFEETFVHWSTMMHTVFRFYLHIHFPSAELLDGAAEQSTRSKQHCSEQADCLTHGLAVCITVLNHRFLITRDEYWQGLLDTWVRIRLYHDTLRYDAYCSILQYTTELTENVKTELINKLLCTIWVVWIRHIV